MTAFLEAVARAADGPPRVVLSYGNPGSLGLGDAAILTRHYFALKQAWPALRLTVHTNEDALWHALCSRSVRCRPTVSHALLTHGADLVVFDGVDLDPLDALLQTSQAVILDIPPGGNACRYRLPDSDWIAVAMPPNVNRPRRIFEAYEALGLPRATIARRPKRVRQRFVFLNPYASHKEKCLPPALLDTLLERVPAACCGFDVVVPAAPERVAEADVPLYAQLDSLLQSAVARGSVKRRPSMTLDEYIRTIGSAACVIGPDSSTQHIAAIAGTPSIAVYPPESHFNFIVWSALDASSISLDMPGREASPALDAVALLVALLARELARNGAQAAASDRFEERALLEEWRRVARGEATVEAGAQALARTDCAMHAALPDTWSHIVRAELHWTLDGIRRRIETNERDDDLSRAELESVNACNVLRILSATNAVAYADA